MYFVLFNVEIIRGFTSTYAEICLSTSYPFGFTLGIKSPPLDTLKFILSILINQDKKVDFIRVDDDCALEIYS